MFSFTFFAVVHIAVVHIYIQYCRRNLFAKDKISFVYYTLFIFVNKEIFLLVFKLFNVSVLFISTFFFKKEDFR